MTEPPVPEPTPREAEGPDVRKPYVAPRLVTHGTIQDLTQALSQPGGDNNPGMPNGSTM
jgi:hypothetical protein